MSPVRTAVRPAPAAGSRPCLLATPEGFCPGLRPRQKPSSVAELKKRTPASAGVLY